MLPKMFSGKASDASADVSIGQAPKEESVGQPMQESVSTEGEAEATTEKLSEAPSKMALATTLYRQMTRKKGTTRKEIVTAFIEEVGLTKAGAATYYQMIKKARR